MSVFKKQIKKVRDHSKGKGCDCAAWSEFECCCSNVDWRSDKEVACETALMYCLKKLNDLYKNEDNYRLGSIISETEQILNAKK